MLDQKKLGIGIRSYFNKYFKNAKEEVLNELNSSGYKEVITSVSISDDFENISISFSDNIEIDKGQDIIELLCQGGAVKKKGTEKEFVLIPGSPVLKKILSKR